MDGHGSSVHMPDVSMEEEKRLLARITDAWSKLDSVIFLQVQARVSCRSALGCLSLQ